MSIVCIGTFKVITVKCLKEVYHFAHAVGYLALGKMLGQILVTKQTGAQGKVVSKVCRLYPHLLVKHIA